MTAAIASSSDPPTDHIQDTQTSIESEPDYESEIAQIVDAASALLTEGLPALENNDQGWWRLILILLSGGLMAMGIITVLRVEKPEILFQPFAKSADLCSPVGSGWSCR